MRIRPIRWLTRFLYSEIGSEPPLWENCPRAIKNRDRLLQAIDRDDWFDEPRVWDKTPEAARERGYAAISVTKCFPNGSVYLCTVDCLPDGFVYAEMAEGRLYHTRVLFRISPWFVLRWIKQRLKEQSA